PIRFAGKSATTRVATARGAAGSTSGRADRSEAFGRPETPASSLPTTSGNDRSALRRDHYGRFNRRDCPGDRQAIAYNAPSPPSLAYPFLTTGDRRRAAV